MAMNERDIALETVAKEKRSYSGGILAKNSENSCTQANLMILSLYARP